MEEEFELHLVKKDNLTMGENIAALKGIRKMFNCGLGEAKTRMASVDPIWVGTLTECMTQSRIFRDAQVRFSVQSRFSAIKKTIMFLKKEIEILEKEPALKKETKDGPISVELHTLKRVLREVETLHKADY